ncbi:MAG TPA: SOS response-associated peptidase family protein [Gryllotalpicola sp.]
MCVSFGLDPRHYSKEQRDAAVEEAFREWAGLVGDEERREWPSNPTSRRTYPIISTDGVTDAWWGLIVDGKPAPWPLHGANSRSERFAKKAPARRALVPATGFYERYDPDTSQWYRYERGSDLLLMAALVQDGILVDGTRWICYSILTQDPPAHLAPIHKRTVMLIPDEHAADWLAADAPASIVADMIAASAPLQAEIQPVHLEGKPA